MSRAGWRFAAVGLLLTATAVIPAGAANAADGACQTEDGVTVVVDATALGGQISQRCAPGRPPSGLEALRQSGFEWTPVATQPGLLCRIDGLPAPDQQNCAAAPPLNAYWAYFRATRGGQWRYSSIGAFAAPDPGGVEGWVFLTGGQRVPGITPPAAFPAATPSPSVTPAVTPTPAASSHGKRTKPAAKPPGSAPAPAPEADTGDAAGDLPAVAAEPGTVAAPAETPAALQPVAVGAAVADPTAAGNGSALSTVVGVGIGGMLAAAAVVMEVRRRRRG